METYKNLNFLNSSTRNAVRHRYTNYLQILGVIGKETLSVSVCFYRIFGV